MKRIFITKLLCMEVSNSIGLYAFKEMKNNKAFRNLDILKSFCKLTRQINDSEAHQAYDSDTIEVMIDENVIDYLPQLIEKYIFEEVAEGEEPNFEWVCEMMNIYSQIAEDDDGSTSATDIGYKKEEKKAEKPALHNQDIIDELNEDESEEESQEETVVETSDTEGEIVGGQDDDLSEWEYTGEDEEEMELY